MLCMQAPPSAEEQQQQEEAREAAEEARRAMLMNLLQPAARERRECAQCSFMRTGLRGIHLLHARKGWVLHL